MFFFAHLGGGSQMVLPLRPRLRLRWLLLGTVLPDLIDKPIYHFILHVWGPHSAALDYLGCTRNFGHTMLLLGLLAALSWRSSTAQALAWGVATHDLLDWVEDLCCYPREPSSELQAFFYPWTGHFAVYGPTGLTTHLLTLFSPFRLTTEALGLLLLIGVYRRYVSGRR